MDQRSFGTAWAATLAFIQGNTAVLLPLAGMFIFLPQLLFQYGAGELIAAETLPQGSGLRVGLFLGLLLATSVVAQITITRMAAGDAGDATLGAQLASAFTLLLPAIAATLLQGIAIFAGLMLLILPGLYLIGRLLFTLPVLACETSDPVEALKRSWHLTEGNGFRLLACLMALVLGILAVSVLLAGLGAAVGVIGTVAAGGAPVDGWGIGRWLFELVSTGVSALMSVVYIVFVAKLYRAYRR